MREHKIIKKKKELYLQWLMKLLMREGDAGQPEQN